MRHENSMKAAASVLIALCASTNALTARATEDLTIPQANDILGGNDKRQIAQALPKADPGDGSAAAGNARGGTDTPAPPTTATQNVTESPDSTAGKVLFKPGQTLTVDTATEDITPTYDVAVAQKQVEAYPDSPEAAFILAVALTRTSKVEDALSEVQRARKLAEKQGGAAYFDKMIASYEKMLTAYPNENKVRYGLAWAYYMKAYLLAQQSRRVAKWKAANPELAAIYDKDHPADKPAVNTAKPQAQTGTGTGVSKETVTQALKGNPLAGAAVIASISTKGKPDLDKIPHIPGALEKVDAADIPQIKKYYEQALGKIDEILKREPDDVWSIVYGAHLRAEYTGNLADSMKVWKSVASKHPNNPAPYFFMGEGYLKQGNLRESINNVSRAISLRSLGN